jgi:hypothetical protein
MEPDADGRGYFVYGFQTWISTYSWPFNFIATILIAFYWQETIKCQAGLDLNRLISLKRMKIPAILIIIILLVFEHVGDALRAARQTNNSFSIYVTATLMICTSFLCMMYFLFNGVRVLQYLSNPAHIVTSSSALLKKVRTKMDEDNLYRLLFCYLLEV